MSFSSLRDGLVLALCPSINGGGGIVPDSSAQMNYATLNNMAANSYESYHRGVSLLFDGTNRFVSVPHSPSLNVTGACCLTFWIRGNDTSNKVIFEKGVNLSLVFQPNGPNQLYYINGNAGPANVSNLVTSFLDGNWHHVAALFDGVSRFLFVDGRQLHTDSLSPASANTEPFVIGSRSGLFPFIGSLDDIRVYSRVLKEHDIRLLASEPGIGLRPERSSVFFGAQVFNAAWARNSNTIISPVGAA